MAVELATAYVSLVPSAKGMGAAIGKELGGPVEQAAGDAGKKAGGILSSTLGKAAAIGGGLLAANTVKNFLGSTIEAARESNKVAAQTEQVIKSTGNVANVSAKQMSDLATAISNKTGVDDEAIQTGENLLRTFTNIRNEAGKGNDVFNQASQAIVDMSAVQGDLQSNAILVGKALQDPIQGVSALQRVGVKLTDQQKEQVKAMAAVGVTAGAQRVILKELGTEFGGQAAAQATAADRLKVTLGNLQEDLGNKLIPVIDKAARFLADNLPAAIDKASRAFGAISHVVGTIFDAFKVLMGDDGPQGFGEIMDNLLGNSGKYVDLFRSIGEAIRSVASFIGDNLKPILIGLAAGFVLLTSPVTAVIAALVLLYVKFKPVREVVAAVGKSLGDFGKFVKKIAPQVSEAFGHIAHAAEVLWGMFGDNVLTIVVSVFRQFQNIVESVVRVVRDVIQGVVALINGDWGKAWDAFKDIPAAVIGLIVGTLRNLGPVLGAVLGALGETLVRGFEAAWGGVWDFAKKIPGLLLDALGDVGSWLVDVGKKILGGLLAGFEAYLDLLKAFYIDLPLKILAWLGDVGRWLLDTGGKVIRGLYNGIRSVWDREVRGLLNIGRWILDALGDVSRWLWDTGGKIIRGLYNGLKDLWDREIRGLLNFKSWILGLFDKAGDWLYGMGKALIDGLIRGIKAAPGAIKDALTSLIPNKIHVPGTNIDLKIPGFADGGVVPGPVGQARLAIVHGGELVLNRAQQAAMPAGVGAPLIGTLNWNGSGSEPEIGALSRDLRAWRYQMTGAW
jgi:phage-related protein